MQVALQSYQFKPDEILAIAHESYVNLHACT